MSKRKTVEVLSDQAAKNREFLSFPSYLRGPPTNKYGGHQCRHMRGFKGSKFGAASECRKITDPEEIRKTEDRLKKTGDL